MSTFAKEKTAAVVLAAGEGRRMQAEQPKQFILLADRPLFLHSLEFFLKMPEIDQVCLVLHRDYLASEWADEARSLAAHYGKSLVLATGGARRQDSTLNGLKALGVDVAIVTVHDSARPFPPLGPVMESIRQAREHGGAILANRVSDTVKQVEPGTDVISGTLDRERLYLAQTPQTFRYRDILEALETLERRGVDVTDEAMAFELTGREVRIVTSDSTNLKVTMPEDLERAEALAAQRRAT